jgi:hypothetical protein
LCNVCIPQQIVWRLSEDIRTLKDVLEHTKITTIEIYAHTTNRAARISASNVADAIVKAASDPTPTAPSYTLFCAMG